jgi:hypothetical protein
MYDLIFGERHCASPTVPVLFKYRSLIEGTKVKNRSSWSLGSFRITECHFEQFITQDASIVKRGACVVSETVLERLLEVVYFVSTKMLSE